MFLAQDDTAVMSTGDSRNSRTVQKDDIGCNDNIVGENKYGK